MYLILSFLIVFGAIMFILFKLINSQFKAPKENVELKPSRTDVTEIYKDIYLESYGCFSALEEKFFAEKIIGDKIQGSLVISNDNDIKHLVEQVIELGYDVYGYNIINKYNNKYNDVNIIELGILGKLAGYNYLSVYKFDEKRRGKVYLTYSPPMEQTVPFDDSKINENLSKSDLPKYTLTPGLNKYTNENEKAEGKELACGYPCISYESGKPLTLENGTKQYMCGSVGYPNIKTPTRFAVYKIAEKR
jgi:hypothetical protein